MLMPPIPPDEEQRLEDLRQLDLMLTTAEAEFDAVTAELARIFEVPGVSLAFIDRDTQHYKSAVGLPPPFAETRTEPRELSVCSHVVGNNDMLVVEDLQADERFRDNPVVVETGVRFYAGTPLRADSGRAVGSLCIVDTRPRSITQREAQLLRMLATGVMAQVKLKSASRRLVQHTRQVDRDLHEAVLVQRSLLPPAVVTRAGWQIRHLYCPAERLCGDFLDIYDRPDGRIALIVADVSGHGAPAALMAAMTKLAFLRVAGEAATPGDLLTALQHELVGMTPPDRFITALAAIFDPADRSITLASAGHPSPLLIADAGVTEFPLSSGMVLLVMPEFTYEPGQRHRLAPGDRLLIYTDGATEVFDGDGAMLDRPGLARLVAETAHRPRDEFLPALFDRVRAHAVPRLQDDVALLEISMAARAAMPGTPPGRARTAAG